MTPVNLAGLHRIAGALIIIGGQQRSMYLKAREQLNRIIPQSCPDSLALKYQQPKSCRFRTEYVKSRRGPERQQKLGTEKLPFVTNGATCRQEPPPLSLTHRQGSILIPAASGRYQCKFPSPSQPRIVGRSKQVYPPAPGPLRARHHTGHHAEIPRTVKFNQTSASKMQ